MIRKSRWLVAVIYGQKENATCYKRYSEDWENYFRRLLIDGEIDDVFIIEIEIEVDFDLYERPLNPPSLYLEDVIKYTVDLAMEETGGVQKDAAKLLGISPRKLNYLLGKWGKVKSQLRIKGE
jgi:transcriptional regulator with AAA-type ATPase domain